MIVHGDHAIVPLKHLPLPLTEAVVSHYITVFEWVGGARRKEYSEKDVMKGIGEEKEGREKKSEGEREGGNVETQM